MRSRKRRSAGVSILEIMMSFSVITVVIIAFATVFPSGYRLNFANFNQNKASSLASSVIEELRGIPPDMGATAASVTLNSLCQSGNSRTMYDQLSQGLKDQLAYGAPDNTKPFYIPTPSGNDTGIQIARVQENISGGSNITNYLVSVNVSWRESRKRTQITKTITISGMVTNALKTTYTK